MDWLWLRRAWKRRVLAPVRARIRPEARVDIEGHTLLVDLRDKVIARQLYVDGDYEQSLRRMFRCLGLEGSVCIDVGANLGLHTVFLAQIASEVLAFEPESRNYSLLARNIAISGLRNVTALKCAAGDREGTCRLRLSHDNFGDHQVSSTLADHDGEEAPIMRIDTAARSFPAGAVALLKIDVQGYEDHVLRGAAETLARNLDLTLVIEISPSHLAATGVSASGLVRSLVERGFDGVELSDDRLLPVSHAWAYDFMRSGFHVDLVVSRNRERLASALASYWRRPVPRIDVSSM